MTARVAPGQLLTRGRRSAKALAPQSAGLALFRIGAAASAVIYTRFLGPSGRGVYALSNIGAQVLAYVLLWGADVWANRGLSGSVAAFRRRLVMFCLVGLPAMAVVLALAWPGQFWLVLSSVVYAVCFATFLLLAGVRAGEGRRVAWGAMYAARSIVGVAVAVVACLSFAKITPTWVNVVDGLAFLACCVPSRVTVWSERLSAGEAERAEMSREGRSVALGFVVLFLLYRADAILVGAVLGTALLGAYSAVSAMLEGLLVVPDALQPTLVRIAGSKRGRSRAMQACVGTGVAVALGGVILCIVGRAFIRLAFGAAFLPGAVVLPYLAAASTCVAMWKVLASYAMGIGAARLRLQSALVGTMVMAVVDVCLLARLGLIGAGIGALTGYTAALLWCLRSLRRSA